MKFHILHIIVFIISVFVCLSLSLSGLWRVHDSNPEMHLIRGPVVYFVIAGLTGGLISFWKVSSK